MTKSAFHIFRKKIQPFNYRHGQLLELNKANLAINNLIYYK